MFYKILLFNDKAGEIRVNSTKERDRILSQMEQGAKFIRCGDSYVNTSAIAGIYEDHGRYREEFAYLDSDQRKAKLARLEKEENFLALPEAHDL